MIGRDVRDGDVGQETLDDRAITTQTDRSQSNWTWGEDKGKLDMGRGQEKLDMGEIRRGTGHGKEDKKNRTWGERTRVPEDSLQMSFSHAVDCEPRCHSLFKLQMTDLLYSVSQT